jgi:hypothetical protein
MTADGESQARVEITNDPSDPIRLYSTDGSIVFGGDAQTLRVPCGAAAPLVVNGGGFVGCSLAKHPWPEVKHEVRITW